MSNKNLDLRDNFMKKKILSGAIPLILVGGLFLSACSNSSTSSTGSVHRPTNRKTTTTKQQTTKTSSGNSSLTTTTGDANCNYADLTLAEDQSLSVVSAGSTELALVVTDKGSSVCNLDGYPNLEFFPPKGGLANPNTKPIKLKITDESTKYKPVSLSSGAKAVFYIKYFSVPVDGVGCSIVGSVSVGLQGIAGNANLNVGFSECGPGVVVYPLVLLS